MLDLNGVVLISRAHTSDDRDARRQGYSPIHCWENRLSRSADRQREAVDQRRKDRSSQKADRVLVLSSGTMNIRL